jgi:putative transposase
MFNVFTRLPSFVRNLRTIVSDTLNFFAGVWRRRTALAAENLFLRKQLALFREREKKAMRTIPADRFAFSKLARWFDWRSALMIVKPATLIGWHRHAFRLFWRWKSRPVGRPRVTIEIRNLIRRLAAENPTWGEKRIADELLLKLQIRLSPRTVAKYSKQPPRPRASRDQRWSTFLKNHANAIIACDFFTVVTVCFRVLYVFVGHCHIAVQKTSHMTGSMLAGRPPTLKTYSTVVRLR